MNLSVVSALSSDRLSDIVDKDDSVTFYCHGKHCFLSAYAAAKALAWGLTDVYYFADGYPAWTEAGLPVEAQTQ